MKHVLELKFTDTNLSPLMPDEDNNFGGLDNDDVTFKAASRTALALGRAAKNETQQLVLHDSYLTTSVKLQHGGPAFSLL